MMSHPDTAVFSAKAQPHTKTMCENTFHRKNKPVHIQAKPEGKKKSSFLVGTESVLVL